MGNRWCYGAATGLALSIVMFAACGPSTVSNSRSCTPGAVSACACNDGVPRTTTCAADGSHFEACTCSAAVATAGASAHAGTGSLATLPISGTTASGFPAAGSGGTPSTLLGGQPALGVAGVGGLGGLAGQAGPAAAGRGAAGRGAAGMMGAAAGAAGTTGAGGSGNPDFTDAQLAMLRQTCVDEINMYRATLPSLKALKRASAPQEMCSDKGAQMDGDSGQAHGSARAGLCTSVGLGSEDTCPGWGVGGFTGNATVADALKGCLKSMWAEGEPPVSRAMCVQDYAGCFEKYGHYLNMSDPGVGSVACSFFHMKNGQWWMNQDFAR
jgi:hypothetical protein